MNWTGGGVEFPRMQWQAARRHAELNRTGVYILAGCENDHESLPNTRHRRRGLTPLEQHAGNQAVPPIVTVQLARRSLIRFGVKVEQSCVRLANTSNLIKWAFAASPREISWRQTLLKLAKGGRQVDAHDYGHVVSVAE